MRTSRGSSSSLRGCYVRVKFKDDSEGGPSFACAAWGPYEVSVRDAIFVRKRGKIFKKIKLIMKVGEIVTSSYTIVIYRPRKGREWVKNCLGP